MDKVITMKKTLIKLIILSIVFMLFSCSDPIFFTVSKEIPILKPFIDGSPVNFVEYDGRLYTASGKQIFSYAGSGWSKWSKLDGRIGGLAATTGNLYAFYLNKDSNDGRIRNCNSGSDLSLSDVQSIHASGDVLFACTRYNSRYTIYFRKEGDSDFPAIPGMSFDSMLNGVASDSNYYYLCVSEGIYYAEKSQIANPLTLQVLGKDLDFTGIIELKNNYIAAITNDGKLYEIKDAEIKEVAKFDDRYSTGALALWYRDTNDTMPSLLLVGRKERNYSTSSAYTNGYVEIALDTNPTIKDPTTDAPITNPKYGGISGSSFNEPGKTSPSSIDDYDRYVSSLGKKPVNHIIQTSAAIDSKMTLFASTQQNGVWSYKTRDGVMQWNAEE